MNALLVLCFLSKNIGYQQVHLDFSVKTAFQFYITASERCPNCPKYAQNMHNDRFSRSKNKLFYLFSLIKEQLHL